MLLSKKDNVNLIVNMGEHKDLQSKELTREPELYTNTLMFIQTRILNRKEDTKCLITM
jgi:hypothetical protein